MEVASKLTYYQIIDDSIKICVSEAFLNKG